MKGIEKIGSALERAKRMPAERRESRPEWAVAIGREFGSAREMVERFGLQQQAVMAMHWRREMLRLPSAVRVARTYGAEVFAGLLGVHLTGALKSMGATRDVDEQEVMLTAQALLTNRTVMQLNMASLLAFFGQLRSGEIDVAGWLTTGKIARALNQYAREQLRREAAVRERAALDEVRELALTAGEGAVSWDDYCRERGLDPEELERLDGRERCRRIAEAAGDATEADAEVIEEY